jgi:Na+:H+ antiporter, NhaA family
MQKTLKDFIKLESNGSIVLFITTLLAIILANSAWQEFYFKCINSPIFTLPFNTHFILSFKFFVNDFLMMFFFLLVTLEIKREFLIGGLNSFQKAILPLVCALGGIIVPAAIYLVINQKTPEVSSGWAIPTATDIAFALAVITFLKSKIPPSLKVFLVALAIIDDLGAIIIIALIYTKEIHVIYFIAALVGLFILLILNRLGISKKIPYIIIGLLVWWLIAASNIHATIAGVLIALCVPLNSKAHISPLKMLEQTLHPWVTFIILPLFALVNAGLTFSNISMSTLLHPITLGIILGLFLGKPIGIFGACLIAVKSKIAHLPQGATWYQMYGTSVVCGIGFTMSLFIGTLAFSDGHMNLVKLGVIIGSLVSGIIGYLILLRSH